MSHLTVAILALCLLSGCAKAYHSGDYLARVHNAGTVTAVEEGTRSSSLIRTSLAYTFVIHGRPIIRPQSHVWFNIESQKLETDGQVLDVLEWWVEEK